MGYYRAGGTQMVASHAQAPGAFLNPVKALPDSGPTGGRTYRRTNPGNVKALRRAMRRVQAFAHLAQKTIAFTKRVKMKHHRRKK